MKETAVRAASLVRRAEKGGFLDIPTQAVSVGALMARGQQMRHASLISHGFGDGEQLPI